MQVTGTREAYGWVVGLIELVLQNLLLSYISCKHETNLNSDSSSLEAYQTYLWYGTAEVGLELSVVLVEHLHPLEKLGHGYGS